MSIYYDLYENPDIQKTGEQQPLHARVVSKGTYNAAEFLERVSIYQHLPYPLLAGALKAITDELRDLLAQGYSVELGELGHLSLSLKVERSVMEKKELRSPSVRLKNVNLQVGHPFKAELRAKMDLERAQSPLRAKSPLTEDQCLSRLNKFLDETPCISRADYAALTGKSKIQAVRDIHLFLENGLLQKYGTGRSVVYIKKKPL